MQDIIEYGAFVRRMPERAEPEAAIDEVRGPRHPDGFDNVAPENADVISLVDGLYSDLRWLATVSDAVGFKIAMRAYIDKLEDLYSRM